MNMRPSAEGAVTHDDSITDAGEDPVSVLFIEDDPSLAEMYRIKLEVDGYRVSVVDLGQLTGSQLPRYHADLIFLDIRAPHRERALVLKRLRENRATKTVPVVILSDYNQEQLRDLGVSLQRQEYLVLNFSAPSGLSTSLDAWERMEQFA
jgi:DNA-binding response OmpR family regulator